MLRLKRLLAFSITFLVVPLVACGGSIPREKFVGLDALSPDGAWATIVEYNGDPSTCHLTLLKVGADSAQGYALQESAPCNWGGKRPQSAFSPDSRFVVYRTAEGWGIVSTDAITSETALLPAPAHIGMEQDEVQFLPNGKLLVITKTADLAETSFLQIDPAAPAQAKSLISDVRYYFVSQAHRSSPASSNCPKPTLPDRVVWATIGADQRVTVLTVDQDDSDPALLPPLPSTAVADVITSLEAQLRATPALVMAPDYDSYIRSKLDGAPSPDAENLLLIRKDPEDKRYTIHLIDLATGEDHPARYDSISKPDFVFSSDGRRLALRYSWHDHRGHEVHALRLIELDNGDDPLNSPRPRMLVINSPWKPDFAFLPDGQQLWYESNFDPDGKESGGDDRWLYLADANGSNAPLVRYKSTSASASELTLCWGQ